MRGSMQPVRVPRSGAGAAGHSPGVRTGYGRRRRWAVLTLTRSAGSCSK
jgi:hypothetical protein